MRLSVSRTAKICPAEIAANISRCVNGKIAQLHSRPYSPNYHRLFQDLTEFFLQPADLLLDIGCLAQLLRRQSGDVHRRV